MIYSYTGMHIHQHQQLTCTLTSESIKILTIKKVL